MPWPAQRSFRIHVARRRLALRGMGRRGVHTDVVLSLLRRERDRERVRVWTLWRPNADGNKQPAAERS